MQIRSGGTCLFTSIAIMLAIENTRPIHGKLLSKPNVSSLMNSLATLNSLSLFSGQGQYPLDQEMISLIYYYYGRKASKDLAKD
jgi:hypothetical protein